MPGLPAPGSPEALRRGLVRLDARGQPDTPVAYFPIHPEVKAALKRAVETAIGPRTAHENLGGVLIRLGPGATLLGSPDSGLDDATFTRFARSAFDPEQARTLPGMNSQDPNRFATRRAYVTGPGRKPWMTWRARELGTLYGELTEAVRAAAPGATLAVATPVLDDGPAGREARRTDLARRSPLQAWEAVGVDLEQWPRRDGPIILRGAGPTSDPLGRDLATHPDLDAPVVKQPRRGLLMASRRPVEPGAVLEDRLVLTADPVGGAEDARASGLPLGHAMAVLDPGWLLLGPSVTAGREAALARFSRTARALPAPAGGGEPLLSPQSGLAARTWTADGQTYLGLANDTPYTLWLDAVVHKGAEIADRRHWPGDPPALRRGQGRAPDHRRGGPLRHRRPSDRCPRRGDRADRGHDAASGRLDRRAVPGDDRSTRRAAEALGGRRARGAPEPWLRAPF